MYLDELTEAVNQYVRAMTDAQRHKWMEFIFLWLTGSYMGKRNGTNLQKWRQFAKMFPPNAADRSLYRLVTIPINLVKQKTLIFKPAPGLVSSWTSTLVGLDAVAGVATDQYGNRNVGETARIGIQTMIPGASILATPISIRNAFMTLSHDYFERYKGVVTRTKEDDGRTLITHSNPGYPGTNPRFTMDDVGELQDVLNRRGGHLRQYEYIVETPPRIEATIVMVYRMGVKDVRYGNDDPNQGPTKPRRNYPSALR